MTNTTIQVSNANQLMSAIGSATGGETIVLADGYYGALTITKNFGSNITIEAANQGSASFAMIDLSKASDITISGVQMTYGRATQDASNIAFLDSVSTGGMYFRDVNGLTLERNDISGGEHTLILNDIQNFEVRSNNIHHAESDLVRVTGASQYGLFENNVIHDVAATVPQHPDLIQLIGINGTNPTDITFSGNLLYDNPKTGDVYGQGLFISEPIGEGYKNILIENNMIMVGSPNSIYINGGQENIVIENNTLIPWPGANGGVIRLTDKNGYDNSGVTVTDNVARYLLNETSGSLIEKNYFYSSSDPAFLATLFQGLDGDWQDFLPVEGSAIDLGNGMGAVDRLTSLLNGDDSTSAIVPTADAAPTEPTVSPVEPAPAPVAPTEPDQITTVEDVTHNIVIGATSFSMEGSLEVSGRSDVLELDLSGLDPISSGDIQFSFNADTVSGQFGLVSRDAYGNGDHFTSFIKDGVLNVRFQNETGEVSLTANNIQANTDYDASVSFGADGIELSIDGQIADTSDFSATMEGNNELLQIGANGWASASGQAGFTQVFDGTIWDVGISEKVATVAPVVDNSLVDNLVFSFDEPTIFNSKTSPFTVAASEFPGMETGTIAMTFNLDKLSSHSGLVSRDARGNGDHFTAYVKGDTLIARYQNDDGEILLTHDGIKAGEDVSFVTQFGDGSVSLSVNEGPTQTEAFDASWINNNEVLTIGSNGWTSASGGSKTVKPMTGTIYDVLIAEGKIANQSIDAYFDGQQEDSSALRVDVTDIFTGMMEASGIVDSDFSY